MQNTELILLDIREQSDFEMLDAGNKVVNTDQADRWLNQAVAEEKLDPS